jgi:NADH dehydrogenase
MADLHKTRIVILGGGFGGVYTAINLEKTLARDADIEVTLVSSDNFFLFTPMLHEVAASDLDITNIVSPIRKLLRRVQFFQGEVLDVDIDARKVRVCHGTDGHAHQLPFDYLVVALGSMTNFYNLPGVEENSFTMKTLGDAIHLRNRVIAAMEEADTECAKAIREPLLTFVVVGGGFSGVETIGGLHDFVIGSLKYYPNIRREQVRMVLVHSGDVVLPELGPELGAYAQQKLIDNGIEIRTGCKLANATSEGVTLTDGTFIRTRNIIWTAGTTPHPLIQRLPVEQNRGRISVDASLQASGHSNLFALGDCAVVPDIRNPGKFHPPTAQHAIRQAKTVAKNLRAAIRGGKKKEFDFLTLGQLATIGRRAGVAKVFGLKFSGFLAWFMWRSIYLSKLPRFEKKLRVAMDWTLDLFFSKDLVQFLTPRASALNGESEPETREPAPERKHGGAVLQPV